MNGKDKTKLPWHVGHQGATNLTRGEAQAFCRELVSRPEYKASLEMRLLNGTLAPAVEQMLWHYAHGKPTDTVNMTVTTDRPFKDMSAEELSAFVRRTLQDLEDAARLEEEIERGLNGTHPTVQ